MEVDTPVLSAHATVDRYIESFEVEAGAWLQTSPEFAMKRLLCAGSGPIYQIAPSFRREEQGRHHNPEFRLLEWYRPGWDHIRLMQELSELIGSITQSKASDFLTLSYREAFLSHAGFDPFEISTSALRQRAADGEVSAIRTDGAAPSRGFLLDLWMSERVSPALGQEQPCFLIDFPADQAALARIRPGNPPLAERFELFWQGLELANGFHELADAAEQQSRFESDQKWRHAQGLRVPPYDAHLIAALDHGLGDCAGVAVGLDRLLMLKLGLKDIASALSFDGRRA